jgi:hypothetical protein
MRAQLEKDKKDADYNSDVDAASASRENASTSDLWSYYQVRLVRGSAQYLEILDTSQVF